MKLLPQIIGLISIACFFLGLFNLFLGKKSRNYLLFYFLFGISGVSMLLGGLFLDFSILVIASIFMGIFLGYISIYYRLSRERSEFSGETDPDQFNILRG